MSWDKLITSSNKIHWCQPFIWLALRWNLSGQMPIKLSDCRKLVAKKAIVLNHERIVAQWEDHGRDKVFILFPALQIVGYSKSFLCLYIYYIYFHIYIERGTLKICHYYNICIAMFNLQKPIVNDLLIICKIRDNCTSCMGWLSDFAIPFMLFSCYIYSIFHKFLWLICINYWNLSLDINF